MNAALVQFAAVGAGGALGALCRYGLSTVLAESLPGRFNPATILANVAGSLLMGFLFVVIVERGLWPPLLRQLLLPGFLGAFTTFSTFSLESLMLLQGGQYIATLLYIGVNVCVGLGAAALGLWLGHSLI